MCFRDVHPSDRHWFKGFGFEGSSECFEVSGEVAIEGTHGYSVNARGVPSRIGIDMEMCDAEPSRVTEQAVQVLELVFGSLFCLCAKFLLHFIDIHRYGSPMGYVDYLCSRSLRKLGAFASGLLGLLCARVDGFPVLGLL